MNNGSHCQFGNKWANLHLGPMWSAVSIGQGGPKDAMHTLDVRYIDIKISKMDLYLIAIFLSGID